MTKDELMEMASKAGLTFLDGAGRNEYGHFIDDEIEAFANAILERAAVECETLPFGSDDERHVSYELTRAIRALKTQGD